MLFNRLSAAGLAALVAMAPGAVLANSKLTLVLGGEGFDGAPKFTVLFGGKPVGDGTLDTAIDTSKDGRFADAADKAKYTKTVSFDIPDSVFKPDGEVTVRLANEAHGAAGSRDDRELYLKSVAVNGTAVAADKLAMRSSLGVEPTALLGDYLVISQGAVSAVAAAPGGGWPKAEDAEARPAVPPVVTPASVKAPAPEIEAAKPAPAEEKPAEEANAAPAAAAAPAEAKPVEVANVAPVPAPADSKPAEAAKTAEAAPTPLPREKMPAAVVQQASAETDMGGNPDPEGGASCGLSKAYQITGFAENSNELTPRVLKALDVVAREIGSQKCSVRVSGYSSTEGDFAHNALFSIERAQNALHYLGHKGVKFAKYSASGVGETTQFGPTPGANRRVVITVGP